MGQEKDVAGRGAYMGAVIAAGFGVGWAQWAASGLVGTPAGVVRVISAVVGVVLVVWAVRRVRRASPSSGSLFSSRAYWIVVGGEVALLTVGTTVISALGLSEFVAVWVAFVVGIHFIAFGYFFQRSFFWVGGAIVIGSVAGLLVGFAGLGADAVLAVTGLTVPVVLFFSASRLLRERVPRAA